MSDRDLSWLHRLDSVWAHGALCVNLPPSLRAKLSLICARTGLSEQAVIIDLLDDALATALAEPEPASPSPPS